MGTSLVLISCPLSPSHGCKLSLQGLLQSLEEPQAFRDVTQTLPQGQQYAIFPWAFKVSSTLTDSEPQETVLGTPQEARSPSLLGSPDTHPNKP